MLEKRPREIGLARIEAALEQPAQDGGIASGVGCRGSALDSPAQPLLPADIGDVLEQRAETPSRRADVMQTFLTRLGNEATPRALQRAPLVANRFIEPLQLKQSPIGGGFDEGISFDLREVTIPT